MRGTLRTLLVLGRVSNLPTVWSNCLAGWVLANGEADAPSLLLLCTGCSLLYLGGMYLNDACDVAFDTAHRAERPIVTGAITRGTVTALGGFWLLGGMALLICQTPRGTGDVLLLAALIVLYDVIHKRVSFAPVLMAACRVVIYPLASAAAGMRVADVDHTHFALYPAVYLAGAAMGAWILTVSVLARREAMPGPLRQAVFLLLLIPFLLGFSEHGGAALAPALLLLLWLVRCLLLFRRGGRIGPLVGDLLSAIPLVDLLMISPRAAVDAVPFLAFMGLALVLRRRIPQT